MTSSTILDIVITKDIYEYGTILSLLTDDFTTLFYHSVLVWCGIIPYEIESAYSYWNLWLIKLNNKPIGICGLYTLSDRIDTEELWLGWLGIIPEHRNQGLGKDVMQFLYKQAKDVGCIKILSYVDKNGKPLNFYKREGFQVIMTVEEYCDRYAITNRNDFEDMSDYVIQKML